MLGWDRTDTPLDGDGMPAASHMEDEMDMAKTAQHGGHPTASEELRGLRASEHGLTLELGQSTLPRGRPSELSFAIVGGEGENVRDFEIEHSKRMHLIVVREDLTGFQHLHPSLDISGTWRTPIRIEEAGRYRVFADFNNEGRGLTLADDLEVDGDGRQRDLPPETDVVRTGGGYEVSLEGEATKAGRPSELAFSVTHGGEPVQVEPYLGADGHLVALREGDLAFLHTHPEDHDEGETDGAIRFMTEYPSAGRYRLFLQFRHSGEVETAAFTREVSR